jgi:hypothetical protein
LKHYEIKKRLIIILKKWTKQFKEQDRPLIKIETKKLMQSKIQINKWERVLI